MRNLKKLALAASVALGLATLATGSTAFAETLVRIASPYPATTLDPSRSAAAGNIETFGQLYARVLHRDAETGALEPGLAEKWEVSDDRLTYTLHLRDAKFSDGTPITADDVVFSFARVRSDPQSALPSTFGAVEAFTVTDAKTVVVKLKNPLVSMLGQFEMWNAGIVSKADVEKRGDAAFADVPVTSGPYSVKEWKPGEKLVLVPNAHYWRAGFPKSDATVELVEVAEPETAAAMLKSGEVDVMREVEWAQVEDLKATEGLDMRMEPSHVIYTLLLNHSRAPFSELKARQAAAYALDKAAITGIVTTGLATPANTVLPSGLDYHDADFAGFAPDMDKAKQLLEESGMAGKEVKIPVTSGQATQQIALFMQAQLEAIGLKPVIVNVDVATWWSDTATAAYDATPTWWTNELTDPDPAVRWALCGACDSHAFNTFYDNARINTLTDEGAREADEAKREKIYREIVRTATEEVAQIPLFDAPFAVAYSTRLKNLKLTPAMQWTLEEMTVEQ
jgi:peptide/nickel transport system substrate-binding protein